MACIAQPPNQLGMTLGHPADGKKGGVRLGFIQQAQNDFRVFHHVAGRRVPGLRVVVRGAGLADVEPLFEVDTKGVQDLAVFFGGHTKLPLAACGRSSPPSQGCPQP